MHSNKKYHCNSSNTMQCCYSGDCSYHFRFSKVNSITNEGISGAGFELYQDASMIGTAISSAIGEVVFTLLCPGEYTIIETITPDGYFPDSTAYGIRLDCSGRIWVNGVHGTELIMKNIPFTRSSLSILNTD